MHAVLPWPRADAIGPGRHSTCKDKITDNDNEANDNHNDNNNDANDNGNDNNNHNKIGRASCRERV